MPDILVIDDDDEYRAVTCQMLESAGFHVRQAPDGDSGITLYKSEPADLVITDILMPEKEGLETIIELRREDPTAKIIAISGGSLDPHLDHLDYAQKLGAQAILRKPFRRQDLVALVRAALDPA
ncbi:MAG: response regulator [Alphaproteobacteria bacterium]|nr:response regulator [Alphaproteobacteria bacterium]